LRLSHALHIIKSYDLREIVEILEVWLETTRLVRFEDRDFCRYYVGIRSSQKPCEWAYFSLETLRLLEEHAGKSIDGNNIRKYAGRHGLLQPRYIRKAAWRLMIHAMPREVARFM